MNKVVLTFDNIDIGKCKFHYFKHPIDINNVNIDKTLISNRVSFDNKRFKYFIGYKDNEKVSHYV